MQTLLSLLYPPSCLHCDGGMRHAKLLLCEFCSAQLVPIDPAERCPHCFSQDFCMQTKRCADCVKLPPIFDGLSSVFEYLGPAATLIKKLKYSDQPHLASGLGAYLANQLITMKWPLPDMIVPVPMALSHKLDRGYNQSELLAKEMSAILKIPICDAFIRKSGDFSQAGLSRKQRIRLDGVTIQLKKKGQLKDKMILLVDDVMTTGSTIRKCAETLVEEAPAAIYGMTVCKAF